MRILISILALVALSASLVEECHAIPAFARKYNMSCTVCHAPFPRLKAYGDEFAGNGFVLKDKDAPRYFVDTGDPRLSLLRDVPLALRFDGQAMYNTASNRQLDWQWPWVLKLLSGGAIAPYVSYYFYFFFTERGEVAGIEDAFLMFNDVFKSNLDVYAGQFQASDPMFKGELALTHEKYQIYGIRPGRSRANLKYDRGLMLNYGFSSGTDVFLEVLNGNGIGEADAHRNYDEDKFKNYLARVTQDVGEQVRIGGFAYWGKEAEDSVRNEMAMFGPDATLTFGSFELNGQYVYRRDTNPEFLNSAGNKLVSNGGFVEGIYWPNGDKSKWYLVGLYNRVWSEQENLRYNTLTVHGGYLLRTNLRLTAEITADLENEEARFSLGFVSAF